VKTHAYHGSTSTIHVHQHPLIYINIIQRRTSPGSTPKPTCTGIGHRRKLSVLASAPPLYRRRSTQGWTSSNQTNQAVRLYRGYCKLWENNRDPLGPVGYMLNMLGRAPSVAYIGRIRIWWCTTPSHIRINITTLTAINQDLRRAHLWKSDIDIIHTLGRCGHYYTDFSDIKASTIIAATRDAFKRR
jgi:hypothetical protein